VDNLLEQTSETKNRIRKILTFFESTTIDFFDTIIIGSPMDPFYKVDPIYPAVAVFKRFRDYLIFEKLFYQKAGSIDVFGWLSSAGYSESDVNQFKAKFQYECKESNVTDSLSEENESLASCITRIFTLYQQDNVALLNHVLVDDPIDPDFSAITTYYCFDDELWFKKEIKKEPCDYDVFGYLKMLGYSEHQVEIFKRKIKEESLRTGREAPGALRKRQG